MCGEHDSALFLSEGSGGDQKHKTKQNIHTYIHTYIQATNYLALVAISTPLTRLLPLLPSFLPLLPPLLLLLQALNPICCCPILFLPQLLLSLLFLLPLLPRRFLKLPLPPLRLSSLILAALITTAVKARALLLQTICNRSRLLNHVVCVITGIAITENLRDTFCLEGIHRITVGIREHHACCS